MRAALSGKNLVYKAFVFQGLRGRITHAIHIKVKYPQILAASH